MNLHDPACEVHQRCVGWPHPDTVRKEAIGCIMFELERALKEICP